MQGITSRGQWPFLCGWCHHELGQRSSIQYAGGQKIYRLRHHVYR